MSDYYNRNEKYNNYGAPQQPRQPQQPPQAPPATNYTSGYPTPPAPPTPPVAPPVAPSASVPPEAPQTYYNAPPVVPQAPTTNTQYTSMPHTSPYKPSVPPAPQQAPSGVNSPYAPPKQPMSAGLKALLIIVITLLFVSLFGFIAYVSMNSNSSGFVPSEETSTTQETDSAPFAFDFDDDEEETTAPDTGNYKESDDKGETDKNFKGLNLNKKPSKAKTDEQGSAYSFSKVENSVVGLICYVDGQAGTTESYSKMGTGIIVTEDGYIVTNAHLVEYSRTAYKFKVITNDKKEYKAGVVGYDSRSDLAVLKIDAKGLSPAVFGNSADVKVTEDVIVVGNPLSMDYQNSVTKGIVSALDRQVSITNNVKCIQTDAAINPGNSGGPLCNMYGQVIGITNSKIALDDFEGMGFAIPSKLTKTVVDDIIRYSYVKGRVRIGILGEVNYIDDTDETGIQIREISKNGPMDDTDAEVGDFITKCDGKKVSNFADMYDLLEKHKAGDKVELTVYRPSEEKEYTFTVTLEADEN